VAESNKFGNPKTQFGDTPTGGQTANGQCAQCEAMLTDALDGTLGAADQAMFDAHVATCAPCSELLAQAKRGLAWLEMLRDPQPEPPEAMVQRILEQTSGLVPALAADGHVATVGHAPVLPFRQRVWAAIRGSGIGQIALQPRLAMTAAMAFFSLALTMDITGTRLKDLSPNNLRPSSLKRTFYSANARVVKYYEGLRVVYELESRVSDLQSVRGEDTQATPSTSRPAPVQPQPGSQPAGQPGQTAPEKKGNTSHGGSSGVMRRQNPSAGTAAQFVPGRRELAGLEQWMLLKLENGTAAGWNQSRMTGATVREGRLV